MKFSVFLFITFFSVISFAEEKVENLPESEATAVSGGDGLIVHQEKNGFAVISLPPGLGRSKIRFLPKVENGIIYVAPRAQSSIALPNPKIEFNLAKFRSLTLESNDQDARGFLADSLKKYYSAYQKQYLEVTKIDPRFSPLEPMLSVALYDVQRMSLDQVIAVDKRLMAFKSALDSEAARFYAHNHSFILDMTTKLASLETRLKELEAQPGVSMKEVSPKNLSFLNLTPRAMEIMLLISMSLSVIAIGLLLFV